MKKPPEEKDILGRRSAAAAVVFFVSGLLFFILWMRFGLSAYGPHWSWRVPTTATMICTVLGYLMPERMVDTVGRFIGTGFGLWP
jgi:hypothetical protein